MLIICAKALDCGKKDLCGECAGAALNAPDGRRTRREKVEAARFFPSEEIEAEQRRLATKRSRRRALRSRASSAGAELLSFG